MAINFPDSPVNGDTYVVGSNTYIYDGEKWGITTTFLDEGVTAEDNDIDFSSATNFELTATAADITASNPVVGRSGTIIVHSADNVTGWGAEFKFKTVPTDLTGDEIFAYYIEDASNIWIGRVV